VFRRDVTSEEGSRFEFEEERKNDMIT